MFQRTAVEITAGDLYIVQTADGPSPERVVEVTPYCLAGVSDAMAATHVEIVLEDGSARQLFVSELVLVRSAADLLVA